MCRVDRVASMIALLVLLLAHSAAMAQQGSMREITGTVLDGETNNPLPGVNIAVKGTTVGTSTDFDGNYALRVPATADTLVFSFIGYLTQDVAIDGRSRIDVVLQPDVKGLEEVVVVGYGTQQRAKVTGSVASIPAERIENMPVTSFENAIQGQLPGVVVQEPTGEPGAAPTIRIRGTGTITAGSDPLYVIDGIPISNDLNVQGTVALRRNAFRPPAGNPLAMLNPGDIQSIEVLKDASSAAIYGSRGSNGVVLITTKKGRREGKPQIQWNSYVGMQEVTNVPDLMSAAELIEYTKVSRNNNYQDKYGTPPPNPDTNEGRPANDDFVLLPEKYINWDGTDTDWMDLVFRPAPMSSMALSAAGGAGNVNYYLSGGIMQQEGVVEGSGFDRYTLRANLSSDLTSRLEVGANLSAAYSRQDRVPASSPYFATPPGIVYSALVHSPVVKPYNEDGTPNQLDNQSYLGGGTTTASNPLAIIQGVEEQMGMHRTLGNLYGEYQILEGLRFRTMFGADLIDYTQSFYQASTLLFRNRTVGEPFGQSNSSNSINWVVENTLAYDRTFAQHEFSGVVGYTAQKENVEMNQVVAQNFPDDEVRTVNGGLVTGGYSIREAWSLASFLARVNYGFQEKYLLTATVRTDRSSRFGRSNQTGVFPSLSVGWRLSEEPFMERYGFINNMKLRASYGSTGNFQIPNYGSISLLGTSNYVFGDELMNGVAPGTLGNDDLSWERTNMFDVGVDAAFLQDRIYFTFDYYNRITTDLLLNVNVPSALGFSTALTNIGKVRNRGWEFGLTSRTLVGTFTWSTDFNISANRNVVLELGPSGDPILSAGSAGLRHITRIGDPIGSYYGYAVAGIYQTEEEIANAPDDKLAPNARPGDFRFKDVNGDGVIDPKDRTVIGNYMPDFTYGVTNTFGYRGLELQVFLQGVQGNEILNLTHRHMLNGEANFNAYAYQGNYWRSPEDPGNGKVPRPDRQSALDGNNNRPSSYQVEDGSYLRLRTMRLTYALPAQLLRNRAERASVYVAGNNLVTWTRYLGFNPEVSSMSYTNTTPGEDYGAYPLARTYTVGVNLTF